MAREAEAQNHGDVDVAGGFGDPLGQQGRRLGPHHVGDAIHDVLCGKRPPDEPEAFGLQQNDGLYLWAGNGFTALIVIPAAPRLAAEPPGFAQFVVNRGLPFARRAGRRAPPAHRPGTERGGRACGEAAG
jgi:hypothetical protein